jgi:histidinol-phosphate aminotransferase
MSEYWTQLVHQLDPYVPGEQPLDPQTTKLNTNENPYPPSAEVAKAIQGHAHDNLRLYPDPESGALKQALATYHNLDANQVFIGNGSDEVLAHCFQAFFKNLKPILFADISYSFYPVYCALYQIDYRIVALDNAFCIDPAAYRQPNGGIIISNPNAPTGIAMSLDTIRELLDGNDSLVIIDEAYVDFGAESAVELIADNANLLVVQTFSKSRSLAGLRLGYALGQPELIEGLNRVKNSFNSYPVGRLTSVAAIASLNDENYFQQCRARIMTTRNWLNNELVNLGFEVLPSSSNFLFAQHRLHPASRLYLELKNAGILVRHFESDRINNYLRISIGSDQECAALINTLKQLVKEPLINSE